MIVCLDWYIAVARCDDCSELVMLLMGGKETGLKQCVRCLYMPASMVMNHDPAGDGSV